MSQLECAIHTGHIVQFCAHDAFLGDEFGRRHYDRRQSSRDGLAHRLGVRGTDTPMPRSFILPASFPKVQNPNRQPGLMAKLTEISVTCRRHLNRSSRHA